ncbi:hypothetical protein L798_06053 [Zootermopsis nevadensis]|uniref:Uncharacterized protein n=1 Tax=Zootermopsis nevadensis TaxID=136037 RepID=A0A067QS51_ZOONE|nr:hypothetical protein L798_06053 [Zootermopsis nevadensis]
MYWHIRKIKENPHTFLTLAFNEVNYQFHLQLLYFLEKEDQYQSLRCVDSRTNLDMVRITSILSPNAIDLCNFLATHSLLLTDMVALLQFINIKQLLLQNSGRTTTQTRSAHSFQHIQCVNK